ncbi:helix-turn-helix domain-containing protein [Methylovorus glucosotrophus]|uniref:Transcriptional regulator, XRE family n=1 Tax=Methylovorus glucosotrophus (strain SIP3-4) TaxID=582744 RepID=C6XEL4_METGS|nr:hypothetical protein [Methylovorus glucosotrophus]ACT52071.1 conserved hypothetical protein [Methylovorus glucosotrophus SIP3-4]
MAFAEITRIGRRRLRMTQREFSEDVLHVPLSTYQGWEKKDSKEPNQATQNFVLVALAHPEIVKAVLEKT